VIIKVCIIQYYLLDYVVSNILALCLFQLHLNKNEPMLYIVNRELRNQNYKFHTYIFNMNFVSIILLSHIK